MEPESAKVCKYCGYYG